MMTTAHPGPPSTTRTPRSTTRSRTAETARTPAPDTVDAAVPYGRSLACHRDPPTLIRSDQVIEVLGVVVDVDLHPLHRAGELVVAGEVFVTDAGARVASDVGGLVAGEHHRDGRVEASTA